MNSAFIPIDPDFSRDEKQRLFRSFFTNVLIEMDKESEPYLSEYSLHKKAIECAFTSTATDSCPRFELIIHRLTLIDGMYSTQMKMRPYGIGELAETLSLFGSDDELRSKFLQFLHDRDLSRLDYRKSYLRFYCDGQNQGFSNLFEEGFGIEAHKKSDKKAISLITKYASFLTSGKFPIYDSIVKSIISMVWPLSGIQKPLPPRSSLESFNAFLQTLDTLREQLGGVSYDKLDFILWHVGKIISNHLTSILTMEDYLLVPDGYSILSENYNALPFLAHNKLLLALFDLANYVAICNILNK